MPEDRVHQPGAKKPVEYVIERVTDGEVEEKLKNKRTEMWFKVREFLKEGQPCDHPGCLSHVSHPCERCGRIAGRNCAGGEDFDARR